MHQTFSQRSVGVTSVRINGAAEMYLEAHISNEPGLDIFDEIELSDPP